MATTTQTPQTLSQGEQVFALRMLPHIQAGMSFEDAARAVIEDDSRLFAALCDRRHFVYVPTADEQGRSYPTSVGVGDVLSGQMSRRVYRKLLGEA